MRFRKLDVGIDVGLEPGISLLNRAIVHVVVKIGSHDRDDRQRGEVGWKTREWLIAARRYIGEVHPGIVLPSVGSRRTNRRSHGRQVLRESGESLARRDQLAAKIRGGKRSDRTVVISYALIRAGKNVEIVRLTGVLDGERAGKQRSLLRQAVDVGG